jgi:hypothetical protein
MRPAATGRAVHKPVGHFNEAFINATQPTLQAAS